MPLTVQRVAGLPPLAWCACVRPGGDVIVTCGEAVEAREGPDGWWFEGAWAGDFTSTRPDGCAGCFGSGGRITRDGVRIIGPSHTLERVWVLPGATDGQGAPCTWASNSLPFLLAASGHALDWSHRFYVHGLHTVVQGEPLAVKSFPLRGVLAVHTTFGDMIDIDASGRITRVAHAVPREPRNFAECRALLADAMSAIARNAADSARRERYATSVTLSGGYDSPACAVLAREAAGCDDAVLFVRGRSLSNEAQDDDGRPIAAHLGMRATVFDREAWRTMTNVPEALVLAHGELQDLPFTAMSSHLRGRLLVTGQMGATVFDPWHGATPNPLFGRTDYAGCTLGEFRLRTRFIALHLAAVAWVHADAARAIGRSAEMAPWQLATRAYDRPVARRIIEDAGIARGTFARHKSAVSFGYRSFVGDIRRVMTPAGWEDFSAFVARQPGFGPLARLRWKIGDVIDKRRVVRARRLRAAGGHVPHGSTSELVARRHLYTRSLGESAFHWAVERLACEYARALGTNRAA